MNDQQHQPQPRPQSTQNESNGLGLAGFIVSLVGLFICVGVLSPIGLIMSLIALGKRPKGFAIAGVVLGAVGCVWFFVLFFVIGIAAIAALVGLGLVMAAALVASQIGQNAINMHNDIEQYYLDNGKAPASLSVLGTFTPAELEDNWGTPIRYEVSPDGQSIWLRSDGPDRTTGTDDDIEFFRNFKTDDFHFKSKGVDIGG